METSFSQKNSGHSGMYHPCPEGSFPPNSISTTFGHTTEVRTYTKPSRFPKSLSVSRLHRFMGMNRVLRRLHLKLRRSMLRSVRIRKSTWTTGILQPSLPGPGNLSLHSSLRQPHLLRHAPGNTTTLVIWPPKLSRLAL